MLKVGCALAVALALAGAAGANAAPRAARQDLTATVSPSRPGARPVTLAVSWSTELQCGRLRGASVVLSLPAAMRVPARIPAATVRIGAARAAAVRVAGRTLTISLPRPTGVTCMVIAPGTAKIVVSSAARLGNPAAAGTYRLSVTAGGETLTGSLVVG